MLNQAFVRGFVQLALSLEEKADGDSIPYG